MAEIEINRLTTMPSGYRYVCTGAHTPPSTERCECVKDRMRCRNYALHGSVYCRECITHPTVGKAGSTSSEETPNG